MPSPVYKHMKYIWFLNISKRSKAHLFAQRSMVSSIANMNSSIWYYLFVRTQWNGSKYYNQFNLTSVICLHTVKWSNSSSWPIDMTLLGTITLSQSGPGSKDNEGVWYIPLSSRTEASQSDAVYCHTQVTGSIHS